MPLTGCSPPYLPQTSLLPLASGRTGQEDALVLNHKATWDTMATMTTPCRGHSQSTFQRSGQPWGRSRSCTASRTVCNFCFCPISDCVTSATFSLQCASFSVETRTLVIRQSVGAGRGRATCSLAGAGAVDRGPASYPNLLGQWCCADLGSARLGRPFLPRECYTASERGSQG